MRIPRFYVPADYLAGQTLSLSKEQSHYALTVLRMKHQRPLEIFNGQGQQAQATLLVTSRRTADLLIDTVASPQTESPLQTILLQGISKGDRMDYTLQKTVELGISVIQPLFTEHCDVKLDDDKLDKKRQQWQDIVISACEQSGRNVVPQVLTPLTLTDWLAHNPNANGLVLNPYASNTLKTLPPTMAQTPIHLLIGPEGGLSDAEVQQATQAGLTPVKLGPRILRTETAGVTVLAILQSLWGDF
ncbi:16S rRNA (uracil(1498)-N(3))-methyltransferase [Thiosulfativibrio zosterae]|uniref:Ribosomal RNA small subunit methyltransferase E n=1 Tax=Thiosulfativibrio zosterae TaxID=2675053 RepID=A0A6F8PL34_9GAMM|nr:16S rRNA (uracil(1498)-N(3))-methyltransferase [Thiosulfativibrio zosterae]BBP42796.1 ribosomal RNA small subunit methyltransferase E [Thiosulfativibrio zosterae]